MDGQLPTPNMPLPVERSVGFTPEALPVNAAPNVEAAPGVAPPAQAGAPLPKLTAADVAAAIAATPTVGVAPAVSGVPTLSTPSMAGDVDVIETEWVDKAEAVVQAHHGDPYGEEEAIEELQEDYLQKRYGIHVANPNERDTKPKGV